MSERTAATIFCCLLKIGSSCWWTTDWPPAPPKRLINEKGFAAVAAEADWPDAYRVHRYVSGGASIGRPTKRSGGSSRHSPRDRYMAGELQQERFATLLVDLLTLEEEQIDLRTMEFRFNIEMLAERLIGLTDWYGLHAELSALPLGFFGASTGSAAALIAAAARPDHVRVVVSRGGRPDLAASFLSRVRAPTLLIVGGDDAPVIELNRQAFQVLPGQKKLEIIPGATHLFEEPGAMEQVARVAVEWYGQYLL